MTGKNYMKFKYPNIQINKILQENNHTHPFTYWLWLLAHYMTELSSGNRNLMR